MVFPLPGGPQIHRYGATASLSTNQVERTNAATRQIEGSGRSTCERIRWLISKKNSAGAGQAFTPLGRRRLRLSRKFFVEHRRGMEAAILLEMVDYRHLLCIPLQKTQCTFLMAFGGRPVQPTSHQEAHKNPVTTGACEGRFALGSRDGPSDPFGCVRLSWRGVANGDAALGLSAASMVETRSESLREAWILRSDTSPLRPECSCDGGVTKLFEGSGQDIQRLQVTESGSQYFLLDPWVSARLGCRCPALNPSRACRNFRSYSLDADYGCQGLLEVYYSK